MTGRPRASFTGLDLEGFELEADMIRVLANPKRLMIVDLLGRGPSTVTEIADWLNLSLPNASQHLRVMKDRGIVSARRDGREVRYALRSPVLSQSCQLVRRALLAEARFRTGRLPLEREPATSSNLPRTRESRRVRVHVPVTR
ncbi:MAG: metalloregulator ArsR/SmtB family transcription factor [Thermoplasmata archaeon]|jgi:ArsR family transcriptional regulator